MMGLLDDTAIFTAIIQQGGFSHAAKHLGLSNGLISRRIAQLEARLGVTLIKRTTRSFQLTAEGELFWRHAERIQQELDSVISLIHSSTKKPKGIIRVSAPHYFGSRYLTPILAKFMRDFPDIQIELDLSNRQIDPIKENIDILIRGTGYVGKAKLKDSNMQMKLLRKEQINLYASPTLLTRLGEPSTPDQLSRYPIIQFLDQQNNKWSYTHSQQNGTTDIQPTFMSNDIESNLTACTQEVGIGKFTDLNAKDALADHKLKIILNDYDWGTYYLYAVYPQQSALPQRTRLLLDFLDAHVKYL